MRLKCPKCFVSYDHRQDHSCSGKPKVILRPIDPKFVTDKPKRERKDYQREFMRKVRLKAKVEQP